MVRVGTAQGLTPEAHRLAGVLLLTIIWWVTEPIPIAATALMAVILAVILGAVPVEGGKFDQAKIAFAQFGNPVLFFLLGGMFIGRAMTRHGLDRRMALSILATGWATRSSSTLLAAVGLTSMVLSMWISNTAATAMIYPVVLGMIAVLAAGMGDESAAFPRWRYASALLLITAYASSAGGVSTPIGTTTNVVAMGYFSQQEYFGRPIDFGRWSVVGVPMAVALGLGLFAWMRLLAPAEKLDLPALRVHLRNERAKLGGWSAGERNTLVVFLTVVTLWVAPSVLLLLRLDTQSEWMRAHFPEEVVAMMAPVMLYLLPVDWARRRFSLEPVDFSAIDWGTVMLFGSGLALGNLMFLTGLVHFIGQSAFRLAGYDQRVGDRGVGHRRRHWPERLHQQRSDRRRVDPGDRRHLSRGTNRRGDAAVGGDLRRQLRLGIARLDAAECHHLWLRPDPRAEDDRRRPGIRRHLLRRDLDRAAYRGGAGLDAVGLKEGWRREAGGRRKKWCSQDMGNRFGSGHGWRFVG